MRPRRTSVIPNPHVASASLFLALTLGVLTLVVGCLAVGLQTVHPVALGTALGDLGLQVLKDLSWLFSSFIATLLVVAPPAETFRQLWRSHATRAIPCIYCPAGCSHPCRRARHLKSCPGSRLSELSSRGRTDLLRAFEPVCRHPRPLLLGHERHDSQQPIPLALGPKCAVSLLGRLTAN